MHVELSQVRNVILLNKLDKFTIIVTLIIYSSYDKYITDFTKTKSTQTN